MTTAQKDAIHPDFDLVITDTAFWEAAGQGLKRAMIPYLTALYEAGIEAGFRIAARGTKDAGDDTVELLTDPAFAERSAMFITAYTDNWWEALDGATRRELYNIFSDARATSASQRDVIKQVGELFGPKRAERIAVTETTRLFGAGAQASYQALGLQTWEWRTAEDGHVDPICDNLAAGGPYSMDVPFTPAHVSCRCWPAPATSAPAAAPAEAQLSSMSDRPELMGEIFSGGTPHDIYGPSDPMHRYLNAWGNDIHQAESQTMRRMVYEKAKMGPLHGEVWRDPNTYERLHAPAAPAKKALSGPLADAYASNQRALAGLPDEITLYRGVQLEKVQIDYIKQQIAENGSYKFIVNGLSSWSESYEAAAGYGDVVLKMRVPKAQSFFSSRVSFEGPTMLAPGEHIILVPDRRIRLTADSFEVL